MAEQRRSNGDNDDRHLDLLPRRERASSQERFIDLCRMLGVPTPNDAPASPDYTSEAGAERLSTGSQGWADV